MSIKIRIIKLLDEKEIRDVGINVAIIRIATFFLADSVDFRGPRRSAAEATNRDF